MKIENDPLYYLISEAHEILPNVSCYEFVDNDDGTNRIKLCQFGLYTKSSQDKYLNCIERIREMEHNGNLNSSLHIK